MNEVMIKNSESAILKLEADLKKLKSDNENRILALKASENYKARELSLERHKLACYRQGIEPNVSNVVTRGEWSRMDPKARKAFLGEHGTVIDD